MSNSMHLEHVHPDTLKPYPNNPHTHPKSQLKQIKVSLLANGVVGAILVDEFSVIINGEAVWRVSKEIGLQSIPVLRLFGLTEVQKRKLRIGLNKHADNAEWDADALRVEVTDILEVEIDLNVDEIGFTVGKLDVVMGSKEADPEDEAVPKVADIAVSQVGDIWIACHHRVGCGDTMDRDFLGRVVGTKKVDACITDPPYNRSIQGDVTTDRGGNRHREFGMAFGEMSHDAFAGFLGDSLGAAASVSRDGAVHFVFMDQHHLDVLLGVCHQTYSRRLNICVWNKSNAGMGGLYRNKAEFIVVSVVGDGPYLNTVELGKHGRNRTTVWDYPSVNTFGGSRRRDLELHPTVKPVGLVGDAIKDVTKRGDLVLDGFLGSGTCLLACERTGRLCRGVELDPLYVDLALQRWSERTGEEPILEATGETFSEVRARRSASSEADHVG